MTVQGQNLVGRFLEFLDWEHDLSSTVENLPSELKPVGSFKTSIKARSILYLGNRKIWAQFQIA